MAFAKKEQEDRQERIKNVGALSENLASLMYATHNGTDVLKMPDYCERLLEKLAGNPDAVEGFIYRAIDRNRKALKRRNGEAGKAGKLESLEFYHKRHMKAYKEAFRDAVNAIEAIKQASYSYTQTNAVSEAMEHAASAVVDAIRMLEEGIPKTDLTSLIRQEFGSEFAKNDLDVSKRRFLADVYLEYNSHGPTLRNRILDDMPQMLFDLMLKDCMHMLKFVKAFENAYAQQEALKNASEAYAKAVREAL